MHLVVFGMTQNPLPSLCSISFHSILFPAMVMGGAIASVIFNIQLKHPHKDGPIIDYREC